MLILISFVIAAIFAVWWLVFRKEPSRMCGGSFLADEENLTIQEYENLREKYIQRQQKKKNEMATAMQFEEKKQ